VKQGEKIIIDCSQVSEERGGRQDNEMTMVAGARCGDQEDFGLGGFQRHAVVG